MNERETNALERVKRKERERITRTSTENDIDIQRRISRSDYEELCSINNEDTFDQNALAFFSRKQTSAVFGGGFSRHSFSLCCLREERTRALL